MATSGSVNYTQNRLEVLEDTLSLIGVKGAGKSADAEDLRFCNNMLNGMLKAWANKGIHLWAVKEAVLFCDKNVGEYILGSGSSNARAADWDDTVLTQLSSAGAASATSLSVGTTIGMTVGDAIGVVLESGLVHWTTIATIPTSTTLTITSGLSTAAASSANVYTYTSRINKPLKIHSMRRTYDIDDSSSESAMLEQAMQEISMADYNNIPSKHLSGAPNSYYYRPELSTTRLSMWPVPATADYYFRFTYSRAIEDMDSALDNFDLPVEWLEAIKYQLALRVGSAFGKAQLVMTLLAPMASQMFQDMLMYGDDLLSINVSPDLGD